jgi:hypothetical protein
VVDASVEVVAVGNSIQRIKNAVPQKNKNIHSIHIIRPGILTVFTFSRRELLMP